jgi:hypothetical protein
MTINNVQKKLEKEIDNAVKKMLRSEKKTISKDVVIPNDFQSFNEMIGFPINKNSNKPQQMTWYQIQYHDVINKFHRVIMNKSRKIGATEAAIRSIAMNVFDRYKGHDIMIVAGNELRIAKEILIRFDELFRDKRRLGYSFKEPGKDGKVWRYDELIRRSTFGNTPEIEFRNGTRVMAFAASKSEKNQYARGTDDVVCIFVSEAAHTGMKKDQPLMNALQPNLANRDDGDFIIESTPNGRRGFFYNYWMNSMKILSKEFNISMTAHQELVDHLVYLWQNKKNLPADLDWFSLMFDYTEGIKAGVLSEKFVETERRNPQLDFDQEYCGKFTSTYTQAIDTSNLQFLPKEKADDESQDLLTLVGKKSVE